MFHCYKSNPLFLKTFYWAHPMQGQWLRSFSNLNTFWFQRGHVEGSFPQRNSSLQSSNSSVDSEVYLTKPLYDELAKESTEKYDKPTPYGTFNRPTNDSTKLWHTIQTKIFYILCSYPWMKKSQKYLLLHLLSIIYFLSHVTELGWDALSICVFLA